MKLDLGESRLTTLDFNKGEYLDSLNLKSASHVFSLVTGVKEEKSGLLLHLQ